MKKVVLATVFMLVTCFAFSADVDGKWTAEMDMMGTPMVLNYTFKADGNTLTGTNGAEGMGPETPISEGKIDGNNISFVVVVDAMGMEMRINHTGKIEGNEIKLNMDMGMGEPMELTLKKAK